LAETSRKVNEINAVIEAGVVTSQNCYHCGLSVPEKTHFPVTINGQVRLMCCPGCQAVAMAIVDGGLENFYQFRTQTNNKADPAKQNLDIYNLAEVQSSFVIDLTSDSKQASLLLEGLSCAACSWLIESHLKKNPAIKSVSVNVTTHRCSLVWQADYPLSAIFQSLIDIGYQPRPATDQQQQELIKKENRIALFRIGVAGFGSMQAMMVAVGLYAGASGFWMDFLRWLSLLVATPVVFFSAKPFFQNAWRSLQQRYLIMDVPVALAIGLAYLASVYATVTRTGEVYFESVSMFTFFLLLGRYIELRARHRNRLAFSNLAQLMPLTACCVRNQKEEYLPITALKVGDQVLVKSGETFPCDGRVLEGNSSVIESLLTGESQAVSKSVGDLVIAGTLNHHSSLKIQVTAVGADTQLSAIEKLAVQAAEDKPNQLVMADRIARFFIARLLIFCVLVMGFWLWYQPERAFWITLSVLVVTCPCALALSIPAALSAATTRLRQYGFLITRGHVIETLTKINRVIVDKTGTLTKGQFVVNQVKLLVNEQHALASQETVLSIAAAMEHSSNHPLASAFLNWSGKYTAVNAQQITAEGVEAFVEIENQQAFEQTDLFKSQKKHFRLGRMEFAKVGTELLEIPDDQHTWMLLSNQQENIAWIGLQDELRPDAKQLIQDLLKQNIAVELISGDHPVVVSRVANELGIQDWMAEARPQDKLSQLKKRQAEGDKILMLGDGINDIPVLSGADVSVAMALASDLAQTRADAILLNNRLSVLIDALSLANKAHKIMQQNLRYSLVYNLLALPLAAAGFVPPWAAAIGMTVSSLIVIFNALRLAR
jgi:P-type Cu2+ transporter